VLLFFYRTIIYLFLVVRKIFVLRAVKQVLSEQVGRTVRDQPRGVHTRPQKTEEFCFPDAVEEGMMLAAASAAGRSLLRLKSCI
jgi:hypothetical protein